MRYYILASLVTLTYVLTLLIWKGLNIMFFHGSDITYIDSVIAIALSISILWNLNSINLIKLNSFLPNNHKSKKPNKVK